MIVISKSKYGIITKNRKKMKFMIDKHEKRKIIIYILIISILALLIGTKSSPLYPLNDWVDANAFLTMWKGMANNLVPYRDLFEQKGPLLYFLHMLAYFISHQTFLGVFLLEVVSMTLFLYYAYKILRIYVSKHPAQLLLPIILIITLTMPQFKHGDSAEELCLPLLTISLYYFISYFKHNQLSNRTYIINGILAGSVLWIKYTLLGFWFAWMMCIFFDQIGKKQYKKSILSCLYFLSGMLISTIPWVIYFGLNHAIKDLFDVYFIINLTAYPSAISIPQRIVKMIEVMCGSLKENPLFLVLLTIGFIYLFWNKETMKSKWGSISIIILFLFLILGVYGGGNAYRYYFVIFLPFAILGLIPIGHKIKTNNKKIRIIITIIMIGITISTIYLKSPNTYLLKTQKQELAQYQFANIINQYDNPTLLNYGFIDAGFYLTTNIVPNVKYFMKQNIPYDKFPQIMDSQNRYIKEKQVMFIITRSKPQINPKDIKIPNLKENYQLITSHEQYFEGRNVVYSLWKRK